MNADEAIALAAERGFRVWSLQQASRDGLWKARLWDYSGSRPGSRTGYADTLTDLGEGVTPTAAILDAMERRIDPLTGKCLKPRGPATVGLPDEAWASLGVLPPQDEPSLGRRHTITLSRAFVGLSAALTEAAETRSPGDAL